ncbi:MAG: hypothetical protein IJ192_06985 [Clostridia bacterium]|nr:hypothetical protein [Clostridia bacterium]
MKNTKKILTLALAAAMLSATGITAFAETTNVSYDVQPTYTVTIPATVDLGDNDVTANIEASDVILEDGKQIKVDLTAASNTASGSTFNAKNGDSTVTYTITGDKGIAVGDTVATFAANGSKALTFSAANKSAATVAGAHTETLTFTLSVEKATKTLTLTGQYFDLGSGGFVTKSLEIEYTDNDTWKDIAERYDEVSLVDNRLGPSESKVVMFWSDRSQGVRGCELKSNESTYNYKLVSINDKVSAYSSYYLEN